MEDINLVSIRRFDDVNDVSNLQMPQCHPRVWNIKIIDILIVKLFYSFFYFKTIYKEYQIIHRKTIKITRFMISAITS